MKKLIVLMLLLLILSACSNNPAEPEAESPADEGVALAPTLNSSELQATIPPTLTAVPTTAPTVEMEEDTPVPSPAGDFAATTPPPTDSPPPTAEMVMDGQNPDGSFFRGLATAPITMFDYSDFL